MMVSGQDPAFGSLDKFQKFNDFRKLFDFAFNFSDSIGCVQTGTEENVIDFLDGADRVRCESVTAHSNDIETANSAVSSIPDHERGKVHGNLASAAENSHSAHAAELMHSGESGDQAVVADFAISCKTAEGNHDDFVAQLAVVCHMGICH